MRRAPILVTVAMCVPLAACGGSGGDDQGAIAYCHQFVEQQLKSPSSADFPSFPDHQVTKVGDQEWKVSAWVDADNSFGAKLRTNWTCDISYEESTGTWTLHDLTGL